MRISIGSGLCFAILAFSGSSAAQSAKKGKSEAPPFSIVISAAHEVVSAGAPIPVVVTFRNTSSHDIGIERAPVEFNETRGGSHFSISMAPGEALKIDFEIDKAYDLSKPGAYTIQLSRLDEATKGEAKSKYDYSDGDEIGSGSSATLASAALLPHLHFAVSPNEFKQNRRI